MERERLLFSGYVLTVKSLILKSILKIGSNNKGNKLRLGVSRNRQGQDYQHLQHCRLMCRASINDKSIRQLCFLCSITPHKGGHVVYN